MENGVKNPCSELQHVSEEIEVAEADSEQLHKYGCLSLFESRSLPDGTAGIAFVGGPVGALEFHPWAAGICVVGAHRSDQRTHEILRCYQGTAHIQLWKFSVAGAACLGVIPHNGNCTWDLKWQPGEPPTNASSGWRGTLAAALGDGTVMVSFIESYVNSTGSTATVETLTPNCIFLRDRTHVDERSPVRVVEWSRDGRQLVVGAADGGIEIYEASAADKAWPKWCIPGHESVVMDLRWLTDTHLCSLGLSCVLRLRDIRDPVSTLEQNSEGLSGSLSMDTLEPNVAVVGGDYGYLRVVRLSGADGVIAKLPVKRVHLQTGPFRTMRSVPISGRTSKPTQTLFYTGGAEGILHECKFPRPIWTSADFCNIGRTKIMQKLQWIAKKNDQLEKGVNEQKPTLHLQIGNPKEPQKSDLKDVSLVEIKDLCPRPDETVTGSEPEGVKKSNGKNIGLADLQDLSAQPDGSKTGSGKRGAKEQSDVERVTREDKTPAAKKVPGRKSRALGKVDSGKEYTLFGEQYKQKAVITRVAISEQSDILVVGIDGGVITWMALALAKHALALEQEDAQDSAPPPLRKKIIKPPRKRGRPRKFALPDDDVAGEFVASTPATGTAGLPKIPVALPPNGLAATNAVAVTTSGNKEPIGAAPTKDTPKEVKPKRPRGRPRHGPPVFGPKRKRGRPRKQVGADEDTATQVPKTRRKKAKGKKGARKAKEAAVQKEFVEAHAEDDGAGEESDGASVSLGSLSGGALEKAPDVEPPAVGNTAAHGSGKVPANDKDRPGVKEHVNKTTSLKSRSVEPASGMVASNGAASSITDKEAPNAAGNRKGPPRRVTRTKAKRLAQHQDDTQAANRRKTTPANPPAKASMAAKAAKPVKPGKPTTRRSPRKRTRRDADLLDPDDLDVEPPAPPPRACPVKLRVRAPAAASARREAGAAKRRGRKRLRAGDHAGLATADGRGSVLVRLRVREAAGADVAGTGGRKRVRVGNVASPGEAGPSRSVLLRVPLRASAVKVGGSGVVRAVPGAAGGGGDSAAVGMGGEVPTGLGGVGKRGREDEVDADSSAEAGVVAADGGRRPKRARRPSWRMQRMEAGEV